MVQFMAARVSYHIATYTYSVMPPRVPACEKQIGLKQYVANHWPDHKQQINQAKHCFKFTTRSHYQFHRKSHFNCISFQKNIALPLQDLRGLLLPPARQPHRVKRPQNGRIGREQQVY